MSDPLLMLSNVRAGYGESVVLEDIDFELADGGTLALLGRNGAGKSSLLATLMGVTRQHTGSIRFAGRPIEPLPPYERAHLGLGWVPQGRDIFPSLTVAENLTVTARKGPWTLARIYGMFPRLKERQRNMGNQLSGGEQQMLAIGRALLLNPRVLLLDEPMEGLAPVIVDQLADAIRRMSTEDGLTMILVEQHAELARSICMERGRIVYDGRSTDLLADRDRLNRLVSLHDSHATPCAGVA